MEFVFVDFPVDRRVDRNGQMFGVTNRVLACPAGFHTFDLNDPVDYSPVSQNVNVTGTTDTTPLHVLFRPAATAFIAIESTAAKPAPAATKASGARKQRSAAKRTKTKRSK
jgi:hypothetical protein